MGTLIVVRHGETAYNAEHRYTGQTDIPLNEEGLAQAARTAEALFGFSPDFIVSSPLMRAKTTAKVIADAFGLPVIENSAFREVSLGPFEGLTGREAREKYADNWEEISIELQKSHGTTELTVFEALDRLRSDYIGKTVILVTHGFISKLIYKYFSSPDEENYRRYMLPNCGFAEYRF